MGELNLQFSSRFKLVQVGSSRLSIVGHVLSRFISHPPNNCSNLVFRGVSHTLVDKVQPCCDLDDTQTERGAHSEQGGDDREDIDQIPRPGVDLVSNEGIETGLHCHRHSLSENGEMQLLE